MKKKFRIATEGATTDGRNISGDWIKQMASNYDPKKYGARINLEHLRGVLPDGPFRAYGDVVSLEAKVVDGKLALFAELDPTPDLIELSKKRQKVYSSMEVDPDFAGSGQAYLVGLAVTDSPASLGTEMLQFAAGAAANPFASRKQRPENLFSEAVEVALDFTDEDPEKEAPGLLAKVRELLGRLGDKSNATDARLADAHRAVELLAENQRALAERLDGLGANPGADLAANFAKLSADFAALVERLDAEPDTQHRSRPPATGGNGAVLTDC